MYSYLKDTNECGKTAKGIKKNVVKKDIKHDNFKDVLFNNKQVYMALEYTVMLMVITRYNLLHFEGNDLVPLITFKDLKSK